MPIDWVMHVSGETIFAPEGKEIECFSDRKPYRHLHSMKKADILNDGKGNSVFSYVDGEIRTDVFT